MVSLPSPPAPAHPAEHAMMRAVDPSTYGERIADVYDDWYATATDVAGTVETVARLAAAGAGRVLELGVGTGRLAIPLADAGLEVHGIDASPAMLDRLRAKPGGERVTVTVGDFTEVLADGEFDVVLLAFNVLLNLTTEDAQRRGLGNAAARLAPGGRVVVEAFVPGDAVPPSALEVRHVGADEVRLAAYRVEDGIVAGSMVSITESGVRLRPWNLRLTSPAEVDRLAAAAGLELEARWSGWRGEVFDDDSETQVAVYRATAR
jgi:SAM-dependent methyltransferase